MSQGETKDDQKATTTLEKSVRYRRLGFDVLKIQHLGRSDLYTSLSRLMLAACVSSTCRWALAATKSRSALVCSAPWALNARSLSSAAVAPLFPIAMSLPASQNLR